MTDAVQTDNTQPKQETTITSEFQGQPVLPSQRNPTPGETGETAQTSTERTFTQEDVNRLIQQRLADERKKFADYDKLKTRVQEIEEASKTEEQKRLERIQVLEAENQKLQQTYRQTRIESAIVAAASEIGLDAKAAQRLADMDSLQFDDNGNPTNAADVVRAVAEAWPGLVKQRVPSNVPVANPARSTEPAGRTDTERHAEYFSGGGGSFWRGGGVTLPND